MKKRFGSYAAVWFVLLILFNLIAFAVTGWVGTDKSSPAFWIGYGYIILTFAIQLFCSYSAFCADTPSAFFLNMPLVTISYGALFCSFLFGGLCMLIAPFPYWVSIIVCAVVLAAYLIALIKAKAAAEIVADVEEKTRAKTAFLSNVTSEAEGLVQRAKSPEVKAAAQKVYEALRYSSPSSDEALADKEWQITMKLADLTDAVGKEDAETAAAVSEEMLVLIGDRNRMCKELLRQSGQTGERVVKKAAPAGVAIFAVLLGVVLIATVAAVLLTKNQSAVTNSAKSVVYLETFDPNGQTVATASGFLTGDQVTLVTNYHVIEGAYKIVVSAENGNTSEANVLLACDPQQDLAILRLEHSIGAAPLRLSDSASAKQGDSIYAVGYPLGLANTLSDGVISSIYSDSFGMDRIQITAAISAGSSGGALLNTRGDVIGVTCASYVYGQNLNLAIPSKYVSALLSRVDPAQAITLPEFNRQFIPDMPAPPAPEKPQILENKPAA